MNRRHLLVATATFGLGIGLGTVAHAGTFTPFTPEAFQKAQASDKPLLIEVYAPWCPICARQQPIMKELETSSKYSGVTVLRVDFDHQKDVLRDLHVAMQSTLIAFHGKTETGRLVGVVKRDEIDHLFASALSG